MFGFMNYWYIWLGTTSFQSLS